MVIFYHQSGDDLSIIYTKFRVKLIMVFIFLANNEPFDDLNERLIITQYNYYSFNMILFILFYSHTVHFNYTFWNPTCKSTLVAITE